MARVKVAVVGLETGAEFIPILSDFTMEKFLSKLVKKLVDLKHNCYIYRE